MSFIPEISSYEFATQQSGLFGGKLTHRKRVTFWANVMPDVMYDSDTFLKEVDHYVHDPAGWCAKGFDFTLTNENPDVTFYLVADRPNLYGLSLSHPGQRFVEINARNWIDGADITKLPLHGYRQYLISHEMGHMLGCEHSNPHPNGQPVPIMHQQTRLGVEGFQPNDKVLPEIKRPGEFL
jgi:hypothetical protein